MGLVDQIEELYSQRFLVKMEPSSELVGSLYSPERAMPGSQIGQIVKRADDCPKYLEIGQRVIVSRYAGMDLNMEGQIGREAETFKLCVPADVIMRIEDDASN